MEQRTQEDPADDFASIDPLFRPRTVAVIGASSDPEKIGGRPIAGLKLARFKGKIIPVNPHHSQIQGFPAAKAVCDIVDSVDLAIIAVPSSDVLSAVKQCAQKKVRAAIIFSAGFAEVDAKGKQLQDEIVRVSRAAGMRIMGPNCMGTINFHDNFMGTFSYSLGKSWPSPGGISIVSQSGAWGSYLLGIAATREYGLNLWASTGNQSDVDFAQCLSYAVKDKNTKVVLAYMEGISDAASLIEALEAARRLRKPIVMMKVGTSTVGAAAVTSHTAALAGSDAIYDALFRQYGVIRVTTQEEMLTYGQVLSLGVLPKDNRIGFLTISGGAGVIMADASAKLGLEVPELPRAAQDELRSLVPYAGTRNPLDMTGAALHHVDIVGRFLEVLLHKGDTQSVIVYLANMGLTKRFTDQLLPMLIEVRDRYPDRLVVLVMLTTPEARRSFEEQGFVICDDPAVAVAAVAAATRVAQAYAKLKDQMRLPVVNASPPPGTGAMNEVEAKNWLSNAGIPVVSEVIATTLEEAIAASQSVGFPAVMKVISPDIEHKSDVGGVILNLANENEVGASFKELMKRMASKCPDAKIDGVLLAPMVKGGVEIIMGINCDPLFGPVVMVGLGGVFVEVLRDVSFRIAPFSVAEALDMLRELKGFSLLRGVRGTEPSDLDALATALAKLSVFADRNRDTLESLDINPFISLPRGGYAVDALVRLKSAQGGSCHAV